ncbi:MAG: DUF975 family protein [Candidatus Moraniibacteriota bacterium]
MQTSNAELMRGARESLKGKWGLAIAVSVVYCVLLSIPQSVKNVGPLAVMIISGPLAGGMIMFSLTIARNQEAKFEQLFDGFKSFSTYFLAYVLMTVFILLWTLLLIVPGIIAAFSYSMTYFIIADNPSISASDALKRSKELMKGNKGKYFGLTMRFFGWILLSILTLGIGLLWIMPYMQISLAKFYEDIKEGSVASQDTPVSPTTSTPEDITKEAGE